MKPKETYLAESMMVMKALQTVHIFNTNKQTMLVKNQLETTDGALLNFGCIISW